MRRKRNYLFFYKISQNWKNFVRQSFVTNTYPLKLLEGEKQEQVLFVAVQNTSVGSQFYYSKEEIVSKICLHFGYSVVHDIKTILTSSYNWKTQKNNFV